MKNANIHSYRAVLGRRQRALLLCAATVLGFGIGCNSTAPKTTGGSSQSQLGAGYCQAAAAIQTACSQCHGVKPQFGAPMSLVSYADLLAPAHSNPTKRVIDMVAVRIHDPAKPMPQPPFTISPQDLATLDNFIQSGAPAPLDPTCGAAANGGNGTAGVSGGEVAGISGSVGAAGVSGVTGGVGGGAGGVAGGEGAGTSGGAGTTGTTDEWPADCEEHYQFRAHAGSDMMAPYTVAGGQESHPSFYFTPPWGSASVQAVAFKALIDNSAVIHHWILYGANGGIAGDTFLNGWAPGNDGGKPLPPDVGMYMPSGSTQMRLDVHYNNTSGTATQMDNSGVEVCITRHPRKNTATIIGLTASATSAAHTMVSNTKDCHAQVSNGPAHLLSVSPHMHKLGVHSSLKFTPVGGATQVLNDMPFSFQEQRVYELNDVLVNNGDVLTTTCTYNNTTDGTVMFGQSTSDEMCFNFTLYYPMGSLVCPPF